MSFLLPLGLLLGLAVVFPILAHALRKGRAQPLPFPAAHLVPEKKSSAQQRHRLEDKLLLLLRMLLLMCLALLAASPFVQCSRLALSRTDGASVSAALIIDDSASMRALTDNGQTRLERALTGANQLLDTARPGDSFSIVLAGYPARILTPATTELGGVRDALVQITPSDRRTDLEAALQLARALQADLPQNDKPLVLFSDLAFAPELDLVNVVLPEAGLRSELHNCALLTAVRSTDAVQVEVACTSAAPLKGRKVGLVNERGEPVGAPVVAKDGAVRIELPRGLTEGKGNKQTRLLHVELNRPDDAAIDAIEADDRCVVLENAAALSVALRADRDKAGLKTGAGTVVQAAIEALDRGVRVQTLSLLPDRASELEPYGALFIDDPIGFTPEISEALDAWVKKGGVAVALLGPGISQAPLGSSFAPFLLGSPKWGKSDAAGTNPKVAGTLGPLTTSWADVGARSRATWAPESGAQTKAVWDDGEPFLIERTEGRGLLITVSLPASVDLSDLALRPAFLELMDYAVSQSAIRRGAQATTVGERWNVEDDAIVTNPLGQVIDKQSRKLEPRASEADGAALTYVEPDIAGRYSIVHPDQPSGASPSYRVAMRDDAEHVTQTNPDLSAGGSQRQQSALTKVGISREVALLALLLAMLELAYRALKRARMGAPLPRAIS